MAMTPVALVSYKDQTSNTHIFQRRSSAILDISFTLMLCICLHKANVTKIVQCTKYISSG
jgi:hypothetical protein